MKIKKRETGVGLGMDQESDHGGLKSWSTTVSSFNSVLDILKETYSSKSEDKINSKLKKKSVKSISVGMK